MEPVWNGMLTCDYEASRPNATPLEWDLYTTSLCAWPSVLLGEPKPYGRLRRPGIVDVPEADHTRLVAALAKCLTDEVTARALVQGTTEDRRVATGALNALEQALAVNAPADCGMATATASFLRVMSAHIVNWLLPEQAWEQLLTRVFASRSKARECLLALATPHSPGHVLAAHQAVADAAADVRDGRPVDVAAALISSRVGPVYGAGSPALSAMPLEDAGIAAELLASLAGGNGSARQLAHIADARERAAEVREAWETAALLAAGGDDEAVSTVCAMATTLAWAAESEERRKELRRRYLAVVRRWCAATGADVRVLTTRDLLTRSGCP